MRNVNSIILITFGIVIFLGIIGVALFFGFGTSESILSVSDVRTLGVEGGNIVVTTSVGNEKDNIIVDLTKSQLNQKLQGDGWNVDRGVRISLDLISSSEVFTLLNNGGPSNTFYSIQEVDMGDRPGSLSVSDSKYRDWCRQGVNGNTPRPTTLFATGHKVSFFDRPNVKCFYTTPIATRGIIDGSGRFEFNINVNANGKTDTISQNKKTAILDNGNIEVSYEGSINSPVNIKQIPFDILFVSGRFQNLIQTDTGFVGQNSAQSKFSTCESQQSTGSRYDKFRACKNIYADGLTSALANRNSQFGSGVVKSLNFETTNTNNGVLRVEVEPTTYPILRLFIKGNFLGLERLSGSPKINSCVSDINGLGGEQFNEPFSVENTGSQNGFFLFEGSCNNQKIEIFGTDGNVASGSSRTSNVVITGTSDTQGVTENAKCTITVRDKVSQKTDSCSFNVNLAFSDLICEPNKNFCNNDATKVLSCDSNGRGSSEVKSCGSNEVCSLVGTAFDCIAKSDIGDSSNLGSPGSSDDDDGQIQCNKFGESFRAEGSKLLGIFPGKPAGCYTAQWLIVTIISVVFVILILLMVLIIRLTGRGSVGGSPQPAIIVNK